MFELAKAAPIGLFEEIVYTESKVIFDKRDKLFMYTDGVTEAENIEKNLYSTERLVTMLKNNSAASPIELVKIVEEDVAQHVDKHAQSDDITMMSIVFYG